MGQHADVAALLGLTQVQAQALTDQAAEALRTNAALRTALSINFIAKNLLSRDPLASPAGAGAPDPLAQDIVDKIAKAKNGRELKIALSPLPTGITQETVNAIDDGLIGASGVNTPLLALRQAALKQALLRSIDEEKDLTLLRRIALANAPATTPPAPNNGDSIRSVIQNSSLAIFQIDKTVLDDTAAEAVKQRAIEKFNELQLSRIIENVLDDKALLDRFVQADDHPARLAILNDTNNKMKFSIGLCIIDTPTTPFIQRNLPNYVLDKLKIVAESRSRNLANATNLDHRELRHRLNIGIEQGNTQHNYECAYLTDPIQIQAARDGARKAAAAGGAGIGTVNRIQEAAKVDHLTTWVKAAATVTDTGAAGSPLAVTIIREPNGSMKTTNPATELETLSRDEKIALAKQMAQEYVANMIEGKEIRINCGDEQLGNMLYAALLAIQMEAKKASCRDLFGNHASIQTIANMEIHPPVNITAPSETWFVTKDSFIKTHLGKNQATIAKDIAIPAIGSYVATSQKMDHIDAAESQLAQKEKELQARSQGIFEKITTFSQAKQALQDAKDAAAERVALEKARVLASEPSEGGKEHKPK